ncbi:hypothetical protein C4A77_06365 [Brevibacillus laterosporus]|uniref:Uncharacterized protein n=1 Tax=Brevibacillus laterosporus TaxID=1465 RepID=A0AAP8QEY0_BRELA|nr:hypothetical protein C4A77_06365 [Brevibacillus laterosporus]
MKKVIAGAAFIFWTLLDLCEKYVKRVSSPLKISSLVQNVIIIFLSFYMLFSCDPFTWAIRDVTEAKKELLIICTSLNLLLLFITRTISGLYCNIKS